MFKKKFPVLLLTVLLGLLVILTASCTNDTTEKEVTLTGISVLESTVPQKVVAGEADVTTICLVLTYSDGSTEQKTMDLSMLSAENQAKLSKAGTQTITVVYKNHTAKFSLKVVEKTIPNYTLKIYNGVPTFVNGQKIQKKVTVEGEYFCQIYPEGTVVTVQWTDNGNVFSRWEANSLFLTDESTVDITMTQDYTLWGYSDVLTCVVSFKSFMEKGMKELDSKTTGVVNANDIATVTRPNYVFNGWTTDEITEEQSLAGYSNNIVSFPYNVGRDVTFYGTWKPIGVEYCEYDDHCEIEGYTGTFDYLEIPSYYHGLPVTTIKSGAFVTNGKYLLSISLPKTVSVLGDGVFAPCRNLVEIETEEEAPYCVQDGVLYSSDKTKLICYPAGMVTAELTVASDVREIAPYAFCSALVGGIRLPQALETVGEHAFDSEYIDYIDFSKTNFTVILGNNVFHECLSSVCLSSANYNRFFERISQLDAIRDKAVIDETKLHKIFTAPTLDDEEKTVLYRLISEKDLIDASELSVEALQQEKSYISAEIIGASRSVTKLSIPITVKTEGEGYPVSSIAYRAFAGCENLSEIVFPVSGKLQRICDDAFIDTPWLQKTGNTIQKNGILYKYLGNSETFSLSKDVVKIAESAFANNKTLRYLDISNNSALQKIAGHAFENCSVFRGFICDVNEEGDGVYLKNAVTAVGKNAFAGTAITALKIQESSSQQINQLSLIDDYAFADCRYLRNVTFSQSTVSISDSAFVGCSSLEAFILRENNSVYVVYDGILYRREQDNLTLVSYPAGRIDGEFNPSYVKNYVEITSLDYTLLEGADDGVVGKVLVNGKTYTLCVHIVYDGQWTVYKDVLSGTTTLLNEAGDELSPTLTVNVEKQGINVDGDYYFSFNDGTDDIYIQYDKQRGQYYYYPSHKYYLTAKTVDWTDYEGGEDAKVGSVSVGNSVFSLYLGVKDGERVYFTEDNLLVDKNNKPLSDTTTVFYHEDGTVEVDGDYYFYIYLTASHEQKTVLCFDEHADNHYFVGDMNVTKIGKNAFFGSNIGAVRINALVSDIADGAFSVPGLSYVLFEDKPLSTYSAIFVDCTPEIVLSTSVTELVSSIFFENKGDVKREKMKNVPSYTFFYNYDENADTFDYNILYAVRNEDQTLYLMRASRVCSDIELTDMVFWKKEDGIESYSENKIISSYAFCGSILEKAVLRSVSTLLSYAFSEADALTELYVETGFIGSVENNSFGDKLNNGLYIYDNNNGVNTYTQKWGLQFFTYYDMNNMEHQASRYLIAQTDELPFAVVYDRDAQGNSRTVAIFYGTITAEDVASLQNSISRTGYDISGWVDEDGNDVQGSGYTIPYNQILECRWSAQEYTVYFVVNSGYTAQGALITSGSGSEVKYKTTVTYQDLYAFTLEGYDSNRFSFDGWIDENKTIYTENGTWTSVPDHREITLYPKLSKRTYVLVLNVEGGVLPQESEDTETVCYGDSYVLPVPTKENYTFMGWYIKEDEQDVYLTDLFGNSLIGWKYSDRERYEIYAFWSENE